MTPHVDDRLGAYLDAELAPEERAAVAAHLRECDDCARLLEEMAAVDGAARSLAVLPPDTYFDTFPSRLRARLRPPAARRFVPPVWTLAAAAALLLAVLTPLTLDRQKPLPAPASGAPDNEPVGPAVAPQPRAPSMADALEAPAGGAQGREATTEAKRQAPEASGALLQKSRGSRLELPAGAGVPGGIAGGTLGGLPDREAVPATLAPSKPPAPAGEEVRAVPGSGTAGFAPEPASAATESTMVASAEGDITAAKPVSPLQAQDQAAPERNRFKAETAAAGRVSGVAPPAGGEARFKALLSRKASTSQEARILREAWRAYAQSEPPGPRADEARVCLVEAGAQAFHLSGSEADRAVVERDATAYLARSDAAQAERVRAIVGSLDR